jgi:hypothetical protein
MAAWVAVRMAARMTAFPLTGGQSPGRPGWRLPRRSGGAGMGCPYRPGRNGAYAATCVVCILRARADDALNTRPAAPTFRFDTFPGQGLEWRVGMRHRPGRNLTRLETG